MTTLYDSRVKVKPARSARRFAQGLYSTYVHRTPFTAKEADWLLADEIRRDEAQRLKANQIRLQAATAEFMSFYEAGLPTY